MLMDTPQIHAAARARGVTPQGLDAMTARVQAHFGESKPSPAELDAFIVSRPVWEKLGMDQATFLGMPATWRREQGQAFAPPPVSRRPQYRAATEAELAQWKEQGLSSAEQVTAYRAQCLQDATKTIKV
jgi:hypothetical protein